MKEAILYKQLKNNRVKCDNCAHRCAISENSRGICGVRENRKGKLYSLNYGKAVALSTDPIEKKPLFHFLPNTFTLSVASMGCSFHCANCQNYDISQGAKPISSVYGQSLSPTEIVNSCLEAGLPSISYTYSEPTTWIEYALSIMKLAKRKKLKNIWVSNGFMTKESIETIIPYLDAINIDIKSFSEGFYKENCGGALEPVLQACEVFKKAGVWLEVTTLAIPGLSDSDQMFLEIAEFIYRRLGSETPWHISAFSPRISWKLKDVVETPLETLQKGYRIGKKAGLKYVYTGNFPGLPSEDTFCPKCGTIVIDRTGYLIKRYDDNGRCPRCKESINIIE